MDFAEFEDVRRRTVSEIIAADELCLSAANVIDQSGRIIARHLDERADIVGRLSRQCSIWLWLGDIWKDLAPTFEPGKASTLTYASDDSRLRLAEATAKLERNLVAGVADYQAAALSHEPAIRALVFHVTTFSRIEDISLHALLTQLLSNLISPIPAGPEDGRIADQQLRLYLSGRREDDIIIRLLDSQDPKTNTATLYLIGNITQNDPSRLRCLLSGTGLTWCTRILNCMDDWLDAQDGRFELGCAIFDAIITQSWQAELFKDLAIPNEPISPSQSTFLKILDSYLSSPSRANTQPSPDSFLIPLFQLLAAYATTSMRSISDDARLPKVFEGLILVTEALSTVSLAVQARADAALRLQEAIDEGGDEQLVREMKNGNEDDGVIQPIIETLKQLNEFLPRVKPGQSAASSYGVSGEARAPLSSIKRNLVQLLGILTFGDKDIGDLVRRYGGVELILGMTEVDESNAYLREHALFVVRNLLLDNPANQAVIGRMDPVGVVSESGELLPLPERMRRQRAEEASNGK